MERRAFLQAMIAAGLGATLDPEELLWTPKAMVTVPAMPTPLMFKKSWVVVDLNFATRRVLFMNAEDITDVVSKKICGPSEPYGFLAESPDGGPIKAIRLIDNDPSSL